MKSLRAYLLLPLLVALLAACEIDEPVPGIATLGVQDITMAGSVTTRLRVEATGSWSIRTGASWLTATPSHGTGSADVTLRVDYEDLDPDAYSTLLSLSSEENFELIPVQFSFPKLRGTISPGSQRTSLEAVPTSFARTLSVAPGTVLVGLWEPSDEAAFDYTGEIARELADRHGFEVIDVYSNLDSFALNVDNVAAAIRLLEADRRVKHAEPETPFLPLSLLNSESDPRMSDQWSLTTMRVSEAWESHTGSGARIAVIDVGFHPHEDLDAELIEQRQYAEKVELGQCGYHGNHVAGIAGAVRGNGEGIAGIAPDAKLYLLNVGTGRTAAGNCTISNAALVGALQWVLGEDEGGPRADIVNLSLGSSAENRSAADAIRKLYRAGVVVVAAAGNFPGEPVFFPARMPETIAVAATTNEDRRADYSARGPEVFVSAPGGDRAKAILSLGETWNEYVGMVGTSMAAPAVAGVAALIKSAKSDLTPAGIAGVLADSSQDLGTTGFDSDFGYGRIDALAAVQRALSAEEYFGFRLRMAGAEALVPVDETFELGYVPFGPLRLEVGSDDDWDGELDEPHEWYGEAEVYVEIGEPYKEVSLVVSKR